MNQRRKPKCRPHIAKLELVQLRREYERRLMIVDKKLREPEWFTVDDMEEAAACKEVISVCNRLIGVLESRRKHPVLH